MKVPTRSPTHADVDSSRLAAIGLELEELADGGALELARVIELAEDRGRPVGHYLAAIPLATELQLAAPAGARVTVRACAGTCQRYGALELLDHLAAHHAGCALQPVACLDRCDEAPAVEIHGAHGRLVLAPASAAGLDEAIGALR
ncbi:MAG TPA: hypothetical protein VLX92_16105 [Kofleriaceae bacterium]|nr:hypothetical protein [Kofleriaceae bacterium]